MMPPRRTGPRSNIRWTEDEKKRLLALRQQNLSLSVAKFARETKKSPPAATQITETSSATTGSSTTVTTTTTDYPTSSEKKTTSGFSSNGHGDEESSSADECMADISFSGKRTLNKRIKLRYSTNSAMTRTIFEKAPPMFPGIIGPQTSEQPRSLNKVEPRSSPRRRGAAIVLLAEHSGVQNPETNGFKEKANPPSPPSASIPFPPTTLPPAASEKEEPPVRNLLPPSTDKMSKELQPQNHAGEDAAKNEMGPSDGDLITLFVQNTAEQSQVLQMILSQKQACEKERVALEKKCMDKDHQISRLQAENDSLRAGQEELIGFKQKYDAIRNTLQRMASGDM